MRTEDARPEHSAAIAPLLCELEYATSEAEVRQRLADVARSPHDRVLVAVADDAVVGVLSLHLLPYFHTGEVLCRVSAIVVRETHRGKGIGAKLLEAAEAIARDAGCAGVEITTALHRTETHAVYAHLGYAQNALKFYKEL